MVLAILEKFHIFVCVFYCTLALKIFCAYNIFRGFVTLIFCVSEVRTHHALWNLPFLCSCSILTIISYFLLSLCFQFKGWFALFFKLFFLFLNVRYTFSSFILLQIDPVERNQSTISWVRAHLQRTFKEIIDSNNVLLYIHSSSPKNKRETHLCAKSIDDKVLKFGRVLSKQ